MGPFWWLRPWHAARLYRHAWIAAVLEADTAHLLLDDALRRASEANAEAATLQRQVGDLQHKLAAAVTDSAVSGSALSTAAPEFIITGIPRGPGLGKRLQASRDVTVTAFSMTEPGDPPPRWKIGAVMERLLVIDGPAYAACLDRLAVIWRNWDAAEQPPPGDPRYSGAPSPPLPRVPYVSELSRAPAEGDPEDGS